MTRPGPGKFEGNSSIEASEVLHAWVQNGLVDKQTGEVDGPVGWHAQINVADGDEAYAQLLEAESDLVTSPELGILVHEDNYGFFTYEVYESFSAADIVFDSWDEAANPPTCDICGHTMESEPESEWNGETGNHVACEQPPRPELDGLDNFGRDNYMGGE